MYVCVCVCVCVCVYDVYTVCFCGTTIHNIDMCVYTIHACYEMRGMRKYNITVCYLCFVGKIIEMWN